MSYKNLNVANYEVEKLPSSRYGGVPTFFVGGVVGQTLTLRMINEETTTPSAQSGCHPSFERRGVFDSYHLDK